MMNTPKLKTAEELARENIKVTPEPYRRVKQACRNCGSSLRAEESILCRNCQSKNSFEDTLTKYKIMKEKNGNKKL